MLPTEVGSHADDFSFHAASAHHASCSQCYMGDTDIASGHEKVFYIARIQASVRHIVGLTEYLMVGIGLESATGKLSLIHRVGIMEVAPLVCH